MSPIQYRVFPVAPHAHLFEVSCTVPDPDGAGQMFSLPAWIPGSYMIREFARNIVRIRAEAQGRPVVLAKRDKHTWQAEPCQGPLTVVYEVYAWDLSVRCAHLDANHGFFNGTQLFLAVAGAAQRPHLVELCRPEGEDYLGWQVATTLPEATGHSRAAARYGFGLYRAENYDELVDHPVEMGTFQLISFEAGGVCHEMAITGAICADLIRLTADLQRICQWQIDLFGGAPFDRYLFLTLAVGDGYGGLEHRASSALICSRNDLPALGASAQSDAYQGFLGLCSHEYFHSWNVKRIKPAAFVPYDLSRENYTALLWAFEGFTSYYDDLALLKSGVISQADYLKLLAKSISNGQRGSGRFKQSLEESSFDAWTKFYRQDENAPNAIVSYYAKGALVALALDLKLRADSAGRVSLDDVMVELWRRHGATGVGVAEEGITAAAEAVSGLKLGRFLQQATAGRTDLPLAKLLRSLGLALNFEASATTPSLGAKTSAEGSDCKLLQVFDGGAAQEAGLSAGDVLLALDGLRVSAGNLDKLLSRYRPGDVVLVHAFRRDELFSAHLSLQPAPADTARLSLLPRASARVQALRRAWLGA